MLYRSANSLIYLYVPFNLLSLLIRGQNIATRQISAQKKKQSYEKFVWYYVWVVYDGITFAYLTVKEFFGLKIIYFIATNNCNLRKLD